MEQAILLRSEQTRRDLAETADFTDILYRDGAGRYFLSQERRTPLPPNARYDFVRDREWVRRMQRRKTSIKKISEKQAMRWYVEFYSAARRPSHVLR
jgi:hypothetical protein